MCFIVKKYGKERVAKEEIPVWKVVTKENEEQCTSLFQAYVYKIGKEPPRVELKTYKANEGLNVKVRLIGEGYHAYIDRAQFLRDITELSLNTDAALFVIPKGTKYYRNDPYIVSERIKFLGYIKEKEEKEV